MLINNNGNLKEAVTGTVSSNNSGSAGGISGGFLMVLQNQMEGWVKALSDNKITADEITAINDMTSSGNKRSSAFSLTENDSSEVVYEGAAANLKSSIQVSQISNLMQWVFTYEGTLNSIFDKAANMLST